MASFRVQIDDRTTARETSRKAPSSSFDSFTPPTRSWRRYVVIGLSAVLAAILLVGLGGFLYYRGLRQTPQYSLALIVDAAKRGDSDQIGALVDIDAVVEDFMPQVTGKAVELYGRGLPPQTIEKAEKLALPLMPAVKDRARAELPRVIRERMGRLGYVPFFALVMGADQYLDITVKGDTATIVSKIPDQALELKMRRMGDRWRIVGVRDDQVATDIARKIGQEIIAIATNGGRATAETLGIGNLSELLRQAEELIR